MLKYIANQDHYREVVEKSLNVRRILWIGTADIKDLYIRSGLNSTKPYLEALSNLISKGIAVRILMAKEPGPNFRNDFDKYPLLIQHLEMAVCPRVHFKFFIFDLTEVYVGSANLTGAGIGMKSANNRNFEAGILTDQPEIVGSVINQFDEVWNGSQCPKCNRKAYCPCPLNKIL